MSSEKTALRALPSVERVLEEPAMKELAAEVPREVIVREVRALLDSVRQGREPSLLAAVTRGDTGPLVAAAGARAHAAWQPHLVPVVNATGIVLHTNLGRAPLSRAAIEAVARVAARYSNLEYDLAKGERSSRIAKVSVELAQLTGAQAGLVVNNNAAAVLLALNTLASGREVIVSRGELVEIGGSFRIPDILEKSGATLVEVGTTNRTRLADYERAIGPRTALLVKTHRSNFRVSGFVEEVGLADLAALGARAGVPVMEDLGSGALVDLAGAGVREPRMGDSILAGAAVVTASGDKLLGGPQAGLIVGRTDLLAAMKENPLFRALRVDKMTLAALEATLRGLQSAQAAGETIPVLRMLRRPLAELDGDARALATRIQRAAEGAVTADVVDAESEAGGGAQPVTSIPTRAVAVRARAASASDLAARLRLHSTPIIARVHDDAVLLDVRTLLDGDEEIIARFFESFAARGETGS